MEYLLLFVGIVFVSIVGAFLQTRINSWWLVRKRQNALAMLEHYQLLLVQARDLLEQVQKLNEEKRLNKPIWREKYESMNYIHLLKRSICGCEEAAQMIGLFLKKDDNESVAMARRHLGKFTVHLVIQMFRMRASIDDAKKD
ncbi:MAG: hypothetical protein WCI36_02655 [bacterium]